jgi:hypothetical protein
MTPYLAAALIAILALLAIVEMDFSQPARDRSEYAIRDDHRATEEARLAQ